MAYVFDSSKHIFELDNGYKLACKIVISKRAKRIILKVKHTAELDFVIPRGLNFSKHDMLKILKDKASWIGKAFSKLQDRSKNLCTPLVMPDKIVLPALNETWSIRTENFAEINKDTFINIKAYIEPISAEKQVIISKNTDDVSIICKALQLWLCKYSKDYLSKLTYKMADLHNYTINRVSVKSQRTKWGSCSSRGNINLNFRLILLDGKLIEYLILHELCHLKHMNHSILYKNFIQSLEPNSKYYEKELNVAWHMLPHWILA